MQIFTEFAPKMKKTPENTPVKGSRVKHGVINPHDPHGELRRRIEDHLRKYTTMKQLIRIANFLGVKH